MKVNIYSYRFAGEILTHPKYQEIFNEIIEVCENAPIPVYKGKSEKQQKKDVVQQILNTYFKLRFKYLNWEEEPLATPDNFEDSLRGDFRKVFKIAGNEVISLQIEVEFGNTASSYRDYFKFQLSYSYNLADVCILILPMDSLGKRIDSGVSNFEKTIREIESAKLSITVPILIIGLDPYGEEEWNVKNITSDLEVLKGSKKKIIAKHEEIVSGYISSIR